MSTQLRGHHLICLQFYRGEGYSGGFVSNLQRVRDASLEDASARRERPG